MGALALSHLAWLAAGLAAAGACTGILAGLFGVGGGTVVVPVLYEVFQLYGVPDDVLMPLCIGTSLAVIVPTSISSFIGHYKKGAVDVGVLKMWAVPIVVGVLIGVLAASVAKPVVFKSVFIIVCLFLAARLLAGKDTWQLGNGLPGVAAMTGYGLVIGSSASLMGIGGKRCPDSLSFSNSCGDSDDIRRRALRLDPERTRLFCRRLESSGAAAIVARLRVGDRICAFDATQSPDRALWCCPRASDAEASNGDRTVHISDFD
jgi:hypothetical protein